MTYIYIIAAPLNAPTEVWIEQIGYGAIRVHWRGVSTDQEEEPLQGYKVGRRGISWDSHNMHPSSLATRPHCVVFYYIKIYARTI